MRKTLPALGIVALLTACSTRQFEDCPDSRIFNDWGVMNMSDAFGETDSMYYLLNPIKNVRDTLYNNGDYTDSYYHTDSTRVVVQYMPIDSVRFYIDRMYAVETNPMELTARVRFQGTTSADSLCIVKLKREGMSEKNYRMERDSVFKTFLAAGRPLEITMSNTADGLPTDNSQNYKFVLYTRGFSDALKLCKQLNTPARPDSLKTDSIKGKLKKSK